MQFQRKMKNAFCILDHLIFIQKFYRRQKFSFTLLGSLDRSEKKTDKNRLEEKQINLFYKLYLREIQKWSKLFIFMLDEDLS